MANIIERFLFKQKQCALLDAVNAGSVQIKTAYLLNLRGSFYTTEFSVKTDMGYICATFAKQNSYEFKPKDYYTVSVIAPNNQSMAEYNGTFARVMYQKLKQRYEQGKARVR